MPAMRRVVRWAFNLSAVVSLLLCVATAGLWVRSYSVRQMIVYGTPGVENGAEFSRGRLWLWHCGGFCRQRLCDRNYRSVYD